MAAAISGCVVATRRVWSTGVSARLMYAGRDRRSAMRRLAPLTEGAHHDGGGGHSPYGDRSCCGVDSARGGLDPEHGQPGLLEEAVSMSGRGAGGHLGPDEPGEFAGDRGDHDIAAGPAGIEPAESAGQPRLRGPGPGDHGGVEPGVAAGDCGTDRGTGLVGAQVQGSPPRYVC